MVFMTGLRSNSENYCDVKLTLNPCGLAEFFFFLSRYFKTRANRRELPSGFCATNSFTGRSYFNSTLFTFTFESFIFGKYMQKKKKKNCDNILPSSPHAWPIMLIY